MIKCLPDSQFLEMLAHWFDIQHKLGHWPDSESSEVQNTLRRISEKLYRIEQTGGHGVTPSFQKEEKE